MPSPQLKQVTKNFVKTCLPKNSVQFLMGKYLSALDAYYSITDFERECSVRNSRIKLNISSFIEDYRAKTFSSKEPETLDWLETYLLPQDVFFDIGANIGLYSLYASTLQPQARIYSFEPEAKNFNRLCKNISSNMCTNIIPCNFPLSNEQTFNFFFVHNSQPGSALHSFGQPSDYAKEFEQDIVIRQGAISFPIDELLKHNEMPSPNLMKIDVDGIELKILEGAKNTLSSKKLKSVLVEANDINGEGNLIKELMENCGLTFKGESHWKANQNGKTSQNYIFCR